MQENFKEEEKEMINETLAAKIKASTGVDVNDAAHRGRELNSGDRCYSVSNNSIVFAWGQRGPCWVIDDEGNLVRPWTDADQTDG